MEEKRKIPDFVLSTGSIVSTMRRPSTKAVIPDREARPLMHEEVKQKEREGLCKALHILNSGNEETLFAHVLDAEHASKAEAMMLLALRE